MKTEEEDSPVSGIFEYIGPPQNKLPLLSGRRPSPGYVGDAEKGTKSESEQDGASKMQLHSQADDTDVKTADQVKPHLVSCLAAFGSALPDRDCQMTSRTIRLPARASKRSECSDRTLILAESSVKKDQTISQNPSCWTQVTCVQDICPDGSTPWRMGSPFEGLEFAPEVPIPGLHFPKTEVDPECTLSLQLEDKLLAMDRQATAPSPVPLLDNNHPVFTENLLVTTECCHPSLQSNLVRNPSHFLLVLDGLIPS